MSNSEVAKRTPPDKKQLAAAYAAILDGDKLPTIGDPEVMSRMIVERILKAESFDEAFRPQTLDKWRDYLDVPVTVEEFHLNPSSFEGEGGASIYAVVDLKRLDDGESLTVTCGGRNVLAQLVKMLEQGWTDKPVKLTAKTTGEGYQALWLVAA